MTTLSNFVAPSAASTIASVLNAENIAHDAQREFARVSVQCFQEYTDACTVSVTLSKDSASAHLDARKSVAAIQAAIINTDEARDAIASGVYKKDTFNKYAMNVARAWYFGIPYSATLFQDKARKFPWAKATTAKADTSGKVTVLKADTVKEATEEYLAMLLKFGLKDRAAEFKEMVTLWG